MQIYADFVAPPLRALTGQQQDVTDHIIQVGQRPATGLRRPHGCLLPLLRPPPHLLPLLAGHRLPDPGHQRLPAHVAGDLHPHAPLIFGARLVCCSAKNGQHSIGTPALRLSVVEFHPACVRNTPTASCLSTASCSHQLAMRHLPLVASTNSGGSTAVSPFTRSGRMIHKKS
nr:unnamed protein product [Digitaria exilis]